MIHGFDTTDEHAAAAALLVYATYRSRNPNRFKASVDMWARIERFVKDSAKRSKTIPAFIEALKPRLACETISPRWMRIGSNGEVPLLAVHDADTGALREFVQIDDPDRREFLTKLVERADARQTIQRLFSETAWVVMLVRDRIEREKPAEKRLTAAVEAEIEGEAA